MGNKQQDEKRQEKFEGKSLEKHSSDISKEDSLHMKAALAMCENIDWNVGRLMEKLDELEKKEQRVQLATR